MNILLEGNDSFYLEGLEIHLSKLLENSQFVVSNEVSEQNVMQADIIIISTYLNELLLCHEEMLSRRPESMLIYLVEREPVNEDSFWFPNCIKDAILINKKVKPEIVGNAILEKRKDINRIDDGCTAKCEKCSYRYLTDTQFLIAYAIKHQFSIDSIAKSLSISVNTVLTHLDRVKKKFMLRNTQDIWRYVTSNQLVPMAPIRPIKQINHTSDDV